ncbi:hypothetical protein KBZ19_04410 [Synechococcus sp. L2F]|uniref:hypothetical protein n=1 Tax=Synechococcus sp. L2F TaxID=2823739 RepID=UPI0020CBB846|nr:hypothetical protein [Synechococcus sp. L2F]MCP9827728.1 hypothetical protein [Synechococcus sp. L2F]
MLQAYLRAITRSMQIGTHDAARYQESFHVLSVPPGVSMAGHHMNHAVRLSNRLPTVLPLWFCMARFPAWLLTGTA